MTIIGFWQLKSTARTEVYMFRRIRPSPQYLFTHWPLAKRNETISSKQETTSQCRVLYVEALYWDTHNILATISTGYHHLGSASSRTRSLELHPLHGYL